MPQLATFPVQKIGNFTLLPTPSAFFNRYLNEGVGEKVLIR
jgi:hypothetical protein